MSYQIGSVLSCPPDTMVMIVSDVVKREGLLDVVRVLALVDDCDEDLIQEYYSETLRNFFRKIA